MTRRHALRQGGRDVGAHSWRRPKRRASASRCCRCSIARAAFWASRRRRRTPLRVRFRDVHARLMETRVPPGNIGIAPHSLRAVTLDDLQAAPPGAACRRISTSPNRRAKWRSAWPPMAAGRSTCCSTRSRSMPAAARARTTPAPRRPTRIVKANAAVGSCVRSPKPISATACSMRRRSWPRPVRHRLAFPDPISAADELRTLEYGQRLMHTGSATFWARPCVHRTVTVRSRGGRRCAGDGRMAG